MAESEMGQHQLREWLKDPVTRWALQALERRFPETGWRALAAKSSMEEVALGLARLRGHWEIKDFLSNLPDRIK